MAIGILCGIGGGFIKSPFVGIAADKLQTVVTFILKKTFIPVLPFYVAGFVLKLQWEGSLGVLLSNYIQVFILSLSLIILYISFLYFVGNHFDIRKGIKSIKNMLPALVTGFSTMSSAATMPVTLKATENNLKNKKFAGLIIPGTVNIHLMGDSLAIPLIGLALLWFKTSALPDYPQYLIFAVMFALTKFSCAAVPGGGVIIILPVLQKYLGLDQELISLMTTLYILQDSIFTAANVWGNGAFAIITERVCKRYLETHKLPAVDKKALYQQEQQELKV
jgi:Na+/H+-dicarboxylate symporter